MSARYVTHEEFQEFRSEVSEKFARLDAKLEHTANKADLADVRADIHKMDASIKTWMLATVVTIIGTLVAAVFGVSHVMRTGPQAAASPQLAPVIIQVPTPQPPAPPSSESR